MGRSWNESNFSSIDTMGRYRYENQPEMAKWNLTRLGESLLEILDENESKALSLVKSYLSEFKRFQASGESEANLFLRMKQVNPFIIPRNHLVEMVLSGFEVGYTKPYEELYVALKRPFSYEKEMERYREMDPVPNPNYRTFCGT